MVTPIASITPYQVTLRLGRCYDSSVQCVAEQVDNQGQGDQQGRREDMEQVHRLRKTIFHGSDGRVGRHQGNIFHSMAVAQLFNTFPMYSEYI